MIADKSQHYSNRTPRDDETGVLHLVELTWKEGVDKPSIDGLTQDLITMAEQLEIIRYFSCGPSLELRPGGADYAIIVGVRDQQDLLDYLDHPLHKATLKRWAGTMVQGKQSIQIAGHLPSLNRRLAASDLETNKGMATA